MNIFEAFFFVKHALIFSQLLCQHKKVEEHLEDLRVTDMLDI